MTTSPSGHRPRNRILPLFLIPLGFLLVLLVIFSVRLHQALRASLPQLDGTLRVEGLAAPVTVTRDPQGVPSISAASLDDLLFVQGYITASDRLWQMDMLRRHAAGTLAEVLGPSLIEHDRQQRTLQLRATADRALAVLPVDQFHQLSAYSRGVNAFIVAHHTTLPVEFTALAYTPELWTPRDSLLVSLVMSQDLATSFPEKLNREALAAKLPPEILTDMYPVGSWRDRPPTQLPPDLTTPHDSIDQVPLDDSQANSTPHASPQDLLARYASLSRQSCEGCRAGSNNWVIAAARSASGAPLLSNDMHLALSAPEIWYEASLHAPSDASNPSLDVTGFTLPGVPFVIVGRNAYVAWGFTNSNADVQDVLIEHLRGAGASTEFEQAPGTWAPVTHHPEIIHVRAGNDVHLDVLTTTHLIGDAPVPTSIISPLYKSEHRSLALLWNIYDATNVTSPLLAIDAAPDAASLVEAFADFNTPSLNLVYADAQHIGYHALGRVPVRGPAVRHPRQLPPTIADFADHSLHAPDASDDDTPQQAAPPSKAKSKAKPKAHTKPNSGPASKNRPAPLVAYTIGSPISNLPVDALDPSQQWSGYIPYDRLPAVLDPPTGVLATANDRITPDDYPYFFATNWVDPFRAERIHHLLDGHTGLTPANMLAVQTDVHSDFDRSVAQRLAYAIDHASPAALRSDPIRLRQAADLLRAWPGDVTTNSAPATLAVAARAELWPLLLTAQLRQNGVTDPKSIALYNQLYTWHEKNTALETLLEHQPGRWLPHYLGSWNDLLTLAVARAIQHAPRDLSQWNYGNYHPVEVAHPVFGSSALIAALIGARTGTGLQPDSGDTTTIKQTALHFGPSERFTADLADVDHTFANLPSGQSGNPASPFFLDQFPAWLHGTTFPLPLYHPAIVHTLTLKPN